MVLQSLYKPSKWCCRVFFTSCGDTGSFTPNTTVATKNLRFHNVLSSSLFKSKPPPLTLFDSQFKQMWGFFYLCGLMFSFFWTSFIVSSRKVILSENSTDFSSLKRNAEEEKTAMQQKLKGQCATCYLERNKYLLRCSSSKHQSDCEEQQMASPSVLLLRRSTACQHSLTYFLQMDKNKPEQLLSDSSFYLCC